MINKYWDTDSALDKKGKKVFDQEKKSLKTLKKIGSSEFLDAIDDIVFVDKFLAHIAFEAAMADIDSADCDTTDKGKPKGRDKDKGIDFEKSLKELEKAREEMNKSQLENDKGKYDKVLDH